MRASQWFVIGTFLMVMGSLLAFMDMTAVGCNMLDTSSALTKEDLISCLNREIFDPFIWLLFPLGIVFYVCGSIELALEGKKKKR